MQRFVRRLMEAARRLTRRAHEDPSPRTKLGRRGEEVAARHLQRKGYRIIERNYSAAHGEIDLVAFRRGVLAFVEVRSQTEPGLFDPLLTVTRRKQGRIIRATEAYCTLHGPLPADATVRFDVVTVLFGRDGTEGKVRHVEGAFQAPRRGFS